MANTRDGTPLRRSVMGRYRESMSNTNATAPINDDEEERRQARRRTMQQNAQNATAEAFEDNETLKKCMEFYNDNRLSRDNAWSLSLIDTLSNLLERHHKSMSNFKVAGSSLEASSKVYGLRVDSIYTDVTRMSAGLNAKKFNENALNMDDDDENATLSNVAEIGAEVEPSTVANQEKPKPKKRTRKALSSVTKNKDTLNARLDTVTLQDPIFGKLNTIVGSINASNRLMNNILPTTDSELRLRTNYRFWDDSTLPEDMDYTIAEFPKEYVAEHWVNADWVVKMQRYEHLLLRPMHSGYIITDSPNPTNQSIDDKDSIDDNDNSHHDNMDFYQNPKELSMAFDINAECEPLPDLEARPVVLEVDYHDLEEMTNDERTALNFCRGLRKQAVVVEDLRPIDASSKLEYSYRPMDKISQFWAGPSHWKFKRTRQRSTTLAQQSSNLPGGGTQSNRRSQHLQANRRSKPLSFGEFHDENFMLITEKTKLRKANVQKKWDPRKLKLPTNLKIDKDLFFKYEYAPGLKISRGLIASFGDDDGEEYHDFDEVGVTDNRELDDSPHTSNFNVTEGNAMNTLNYQEGFDCVADVANNLNASGMMLVNTQNGFNDTVLEIATEFEGAPTQVTKVIVPFARRAKVIDMKNLKRCCSELIKNQFANPIDKVTIPQHPTINGEEYDSGVASFNEIYEHLPEIVSPSMADSLSTAVAFYSVLHLANELNLRLIPQEDLVDFKIRKVVEK